MARADHPDDAGINVRPTTLTEKMTIRVISGAGIRRMTRKIVEDAGSTIDACRAGRGSSARDANELS